jgi:hypothetical protein
MKLVAIGVGLLAACSAGAMGGCADETVVAVYGGSGEGGYGEGGCSPICGPGPAVSCHDCEPPESMGGDGPGPDEPNCYDDSAALLLNPAVVGGVEINQNVCTATQITDVFAACIGDTMTQESCDAFIAAAPENQACLDCAIGGGTQPYPMPVAIVGDMYQYLSYYACQAEVAGLPECELPFQSLVFCGYTACQSCDMADDAYWDCVNYAINDLEVCGAIEIPATCDPLFNATELPAECTGAATTFAATFPSLADFYCGAP